MSTLTSYASASARDSAAPAASNTGLCIFRSDTKAIEVSDGTNYLTYNNDGVIYDSSASNTHSLSFDGTNDYVDISGAAGIFDSAANFSISGWYKNTSGTPSIIIGMGTSASQYVIAINHWTDGNVYFLCRSGSPSQYATIPTPVSGQWVHAAMVKDGTTLTAYLTPLGGSTSTATATVPATMASNISTNISFGRNPPAGATGYSSGLVDEVALWDRVITASEVSDIVNNKTYLSPTVLWRLENTVDATVGGSSYNGTNNGATFVAKATDSGNTAW